MVTILIALAACMAVHLFISALTGALFGVTIRQVKLGVGPTILKRGTFQLALLPISGFARFLDERDESAVTKVGEVSFDSRNVFVQVLITLSGCIALLSIGLTLLGAAGLHSLFQFPIQVVKGALSPYGEAQRLLSQCSQIAQSPSLPLILGTVSLKLAGLNLLPLPNLIGWTAIAAIGERLGIASWWPRPITHILTFVMLGLFLMWCLAGVIYANGTA